MLVQNQAMEKKKQCVPIVAIHLHTINGRPDLAMAGVLKRSRISNTEYASIDALQQQWCQQQQQE